MNEPCQGGLDRLSRTLLQEAPVQLEKLSCSISTTLLGVSTELVKYVLYVHAFTIKYVHLLQVVFEGELVPVGASPDMKDKFLLKSAPEYKLHLVSTETAVEDNIHLSPNSKVNHKVFDEIWIRINVLLAN